MSQKFLSNSSMDTTTRSKIWKVCQIFFAEVLAAGSAHFFCFLIDITQPNVALVAGFLAGSSIYIGIWCSFATSGSQINPVVTLAIVITRRLPPLFALVYLAGDFVGTLLFMAAAWYISPFKSLAPATYGLTLPGEGVSSLVATFTETITTFILLMVILSSLDELRAKEWRVENGAPFPLAVMLVVTINVVITLPISGASMNPARSLAAAIIVNNYDRVWIYFVGPIIGTILACAFYEMVICPFASLHRTRHLLCFADFDRKSNYAEIVSDI